MKRTIKPYQKTLLATGMLACVASGVQALELEEIVVTAQKRSQSVQDIPIAMTAMSGDMLEDLKMTTASDVASAVPNLQSSLVFGETQPIFSIRGMSMSDYNTNQASPVAVYVDEAPISSGFMQGLSMYDLERVEVLRGPQGTLYGKNTTGGAINFITRTPSVDGETSGNIKIEAGDYGRKHVSGAAETALIDGVLAARLAFNYTKTDGHHKNHFPGGKDLSSTDTKSARLTLKYQGENFDGTLKLSTGKNDGQTAGVISLGTAGTDPITGQPTDYAGVPRQAGWDAWEGSHEKAGKYETEFDGISIGLNWDLGDYTVSSVTSYLEGEGLNSANTDGAPTRSLEIDWGSEVESWSQDLRLVSNFDGPFNFIAGLYADEDKMDIQNEFDFWVDVGFLPTTFTTQSYGQTRESTALYVHTTYDFTDALSMTLSARHTKDKGEGRDVRASAVDEDRTVVYVDIISPADMTSENSEWKDDKNTGKFGLDYTISDDLMVYASIGNGYRASAFNGGAQFVASSIGVVEPETVMATEIGFKSTLLDGAMQLNGALFNYEYKDQQFVNVVGPQAFLVNGDKSSVRGAELEMTWLLTEDLRIISGLGLLDTEFEELTLADSGGAPQTLDGNELFNAPKVNFNALIQYTALRVEGSEVVVSVDTNYTSRQWFSAFNDDHGYGNIKSDSFWQSNASLTWRSTDDKWSTSLWVKNIEENDEPTYAINLQANFGYDYVTVGLPRRMGIDFNYNF